MSLNISIQNKLVTYLTSLLDGCSLVLYGGTVPTDSNAALNSNPILVNHVIPSFSLQSSGIIAADSVPDSNGLLAGTATFARLVNSSGDIIQLTVGTSGAQVLVTTTSITQGGLSVVNSIIIQQPAE